MAESLYSAIWYRVAAQKPRLRPEVRVQRQESRGQRWYLLVNAASGRQFRLNERAYAFVGRCDGERSVEQVWEALLEDLADDAPTQDEVIETLETLAQHDLLVHDSVPDARAMVRRREARTQQRIQTFVNPLALRVPLGDPSAWLRRLDAWPQRLFNSAVFWIWLVVTGAAALAAASNARELTAHAAEYMLTPRYLLLTWLTFPIIKALHELAHALAVRRWGGEVHEAGFTLFVLVPAPYVDASASAAFPRRHERLVVSAAGIMTELVLASIALMVWLNVQPGVLRDVAFVTMFIAAVSTLLVNANPLLRFDAYYFLCDALDLPNLEARSRAWWQETLSRTLAGSTSARQQIAPGEGKWLVLYAPLAFAFRVVISFLLVLWIGAHSAVLAGFVGLVLGYLMLVKPVVATARSIWSAARAANVGPARTIGAAAAGICVLAALFAVPVPFHTVAAGIVWLPEHTRVRSGTEGFIRELLARDGDWVKPGQVLVRLDDPALEVQRANLARHVERLQTSRYSSFSENSEQMRKAEEELIRVQSELKRTEERIRELEVRSKAEGRLVMPRQDDLPGTFAPKGTVLAHVLQEKNIEIRAVVPEYDAVLVRGSTRQVDIRLAGAGETLEAALVREVPAATFELPSAALGDRGGGPHVTDPADKDGIRTRQPIVLVDLAVPGHALERIGSRAWVRFDHGARPLAQRWYRQLRQALLQHFNPAG
ncbi:MAG TPA: PqqD family peptide modification chaperone [Burkholderiales bacterium]|nr:PqqD family peptide modification chaperone [Burkholderiales bacterium]